VTVHSALSVTRAVDYAEQLAEQLRAESRPDIANILNAAPTIGICGVGVMGASVAAACLRQGIAVMLFDASSESLSRGVRSIEQDLQTNGNRPVLLDSELLKIADQLVDLADCDVVIESVVESKELKIRVLRQLDSALKPERILATNTSTLSIAELAGELRHADRFCGIHFFNPIRERPLVEIVSPAIAPTFAAGVAKAFANRIGKLPIEARDGPGFLVNRLLVPYMNEALELVLEGYDIRSIDQAALDFGMPIGPLALFDLIGLETAMLGGRTIWEAFPDRVTLTPILPALLKRGRQGRRNLRGFYRYADEQGHGQEFDPEFARIVEPYVRLTTAGQRCPIMMRLLLPMLLEATRVLEEGVVRRTADVDAGVLFGLAFPTYRGGLLYWADQLGLDRILELLGPLESLGRRMQPSRLLVSRAAQHDRLLHDG
jgi:3-hydroxyacyl-CoA dehydrogenase